MGLKLLKFEADWCGPCHAIAPLVDKLVEEWDLELEKIDIDVDASTADVYGVRGVPTLVLLEDGMEIARSVGAKPYGQLEKDLGLL